MKIKLLLLLSLLHVGCKEPPKKLTIEWESRAIIGITPSSHLNCVSAAENGAEFKFISSPEKLLSWLYHWPVSGDHFKSIDYEGFYDQSISVVKSKKSVILLVENTEYFVDGKKKIYDVELIINWISIDKMECEIKILTR